MRHTSYIYSQQKIAPIWKVICEGKLTNEGETKIITFYNVIAENETLRHEYLELFKSTNCETTTGKTQPIVDFIMQDH